MLVCVCIVCASVNALFIGIEYAVRLCSSVNAFVGALPKGRRTLTSISMPINDMHVTQAGIVPIPLGSVL